VGWLEFAVVIGCGLFGFMTVNAVIENRRSKGRPENDAGQGKREHAEDATRESNRADQKEYSRPWWEVLNVDRNATPDQIKDAFRREISKYHPDRVEGLGIELRELADRKSKEVNLAYAIAKQQRGS
jgi:DnaJ-class molecular chaperone